MAHASSPRQPAPLAATRPAAPLAGTIRVPGDKSISHRALMLGALAVGRTEITGLLEGEDVLGTAAALNALGAHVEPAGDGKWVVDGVGVGGLAEPENLLDLGNSGTSARLLLGILSTHALTAFVTGDASLRRRPMGRVTEPLSRFGAHFLTREGVRLPLAMTGAKSPIPIEYRLPVPSAQVKSAVLLAGLNTPGSTTVVEPQATRDHTERMLRHFGGTVLAEPAEGGGLRITVEGLPELTAAPIVVPGDVSSAAFPLVAALIVPASEVTIEGVGINPLRAGLLDCLREMGADVTLLNRREAGGEPVADIRARADLTGADIPAERAPKMIDEYPILAVAAACARGRTVMRGLAELRVKESDRLSAIATGLSACGVRVEIDGDNLVVDGNGGPPKGGAMIATQLDHRIAMAFLVLGLAAREPVRVDDGAPIATSFPDFVPLMSELGASFIPERRRMAELVIRRAVQDDLELLWGFLAIAAYEPDADAARAVPVVALHLCNWPRPGDFGSVAERAGIAVGAAWARQFTPEEPGSFYVDERTPEISIGVTRTQRGQGVCAILLRSLIEEAVRRRVRLCLNVRHDNPARRLYERAGFREIPGAIAQNRVGGFSLRMMPEPA